MFIEYRVRVFLLSLRDIFCVFLEMLFEFLVFGDVVLIVGRGLYFERDEGGLSIGVFKIIIYDLFFCIKYNSILMFFYLYFI